MARRLGHSLGCGGVQRPVPGDWPCTHDPHAGGRGMMPTARLSRRGFLRLAAGGGAAMSLGGVGAYSYARFVEPWWFEIVRQELELPGLPDAFAGLTVAQISDLHLGRYAVAEDLEPAMRATQALGSDAIVLTGDFVSRVDYGEADMLVQ